MGRPEKPRMVVTEYDPAPKKQTLIVLAAPVLRNVRIRRVPTHCLEKNGSAEAKSR